MHKAREHVCSTWILQGCGCKYALFLDVCVRMSLDDSCSVPDAGYDNTAILCIFDAFLSEYGLFFV